MARGFLFRAIKGVVLLMVYECAIDPKVVTAWSERGQRNLIITRFGLGAPCVVSRYPKKWHRLILEEFTHSSYSQSPLNRMRFDDIVTQLKQVGVTIKRYGAPWNTMKDWLHNTENEHARIPFDLIASTENPRENERVEVAGQIAWPEKKSRRPIRSKSELKRATAPLLLIASKVVSVDQHQIS